MVPLVALGICAAITDVLGVNEALVPKPDPIPFQVSDPKLHHRLWVKLLFALEIVIETAEPIVVPEVALIVLGL